MRQEPDFFGDSELPLLYIAKKLREALALEELLTDAQIDYLVEPDTYRGGIIFASERVGAFFYVAPETLEEAKRVLAENRYRPTKLSKRLRPAKLLRAFFRSRVG